MTLFTSTVLVVTGVVWLLVILNRVIGANRRARERPHHESTTTVHLVICLAWAFAVLPSALGLLQRGRSDHQFIAADVTPVQSWLQTGISAALILCCCRLIVENINRAPSASVLRLGALLAPWIGLELFGGLSAGYVSGQQFVLYPLVMLALWLAAPPLAVARTVGVLGATTALASIVAAAVSPLALVDGGAPGAEKAILGDGSLLLAGPYSAANTFGLTLALAAPCLLLLERRWLRVAGLLVIAYALLWTAGRTSLFAAGAGLAVYFLTPRIRLRRLFYGLVLAAGTALAVATPFLVDDAGAYTSRGLVWITSIDEWRRNHLWFGSGPLYYERSEFMSYVFSFKIIAGHNLVVDTLVRGGLFALAGVMFLLAAVINQAFRLAPVSAFPLAYAVTFVYLSWLEVPLNVTNLGSLGYASWLPLALIAFSKKASAQEERAALELPRSQAVLI